MKNQTPLHCTLENNSIEMFEILLSKGADINIIDNHFQIRIILLLIKLISRKLWKLNKNDQTALLLAVNNIKELAGILISKGADINIKDFCFLKRII